VLYKWNQDRTLYNSLIDWGTIPVESGIGPYITA
jgi:hypothetical protein